MHPIRYQKAKDEASAVAAAAGHDDVAYLAGGTSLVDLMKLEVLRPQAVIDVNGLPLDKIEIGAEGVRIGAMVRNSDLAHHAAIKSGWPLLSEALLAGATEQIRNMATVGGNLLQRTRCWYYRDGFSPCNKRAPGSGCAALDGDNRMHAVLGGSAKCIAVHPSDMAVAMVALDAQVHVRGGKGERKIALGELHVLPGDHPEKETVLEPGELIVAVTLPPADKLAQGRYLKVRDRSSYAFALVSVAAALELAGGTIRDARVALGGVGTRPWRAVEAEQALKGKAPSTKLFEEAAVAALAGAKPLPDNGFKVKLAQRAIVRALSTVRGAS